MAFEFDAFTASFTENGKSISDDDLKRIILLFLMLLGEEVESLAVRVATGEMSIEQWQSEFSALVKSGHIASMLLGTGGIDRFSTRDRAFVEAELRFSLDRLNRFARLIEDGNFPRVRTTEAIASRARLYANTANHLFEEGRRSSHRDAVNSDGDPAFSYEKNVLGPAEHCGECVEETDRGWVPIGSLKPIGSRQCMANCKCRLIFI